MLKELGATQTVDYRSESYAEDIGGKVDLVADCIGDREGTIGKIAKVVKNSEESIVAILLPIRFGGREASSVKMELEEGVLPDKVKVSLVRTHFYEQVSWNVYRSCRILCLRYHFATESLPAGQSATASDRRTRCKRNHQAFHNQARRGRERYKEVPEGYRSASSGRCVGRATGS